MRTVLCLICLLSLTHAADLRGNSAQRRVESNATIVGGDDNLAIPYFARFSNSACGGALIGKGRLTSLGVKGESNTLYCFVR